MTELRYAGLAEHGTPVVFSHHVIGKCIPIEALNPELEVVCARFRLVENALPIERITVEKAMNDTIMIRIDTRVLDVETGEPKKVVFGQVFRGDDIRFAKSLSEGLGNALRHSLRAAMEHEIDEVLMLDVDHFTDPHPEAKYKPDLT